MEFSANTFKRAFFALVVVLVSSTYGWATVSIDSIQVTHGSCGNNDGTFEVFASGDAPFQYSADSGQTFQTDSSFQNLGPGTYYVYVTGSAGELDSAIVTVFAIGGVVIDSVDALDPACAGESTGSIDVFASGGTTPFTYSLDSGATFQSSSVFSGLPAGQYNIAVMDDDSCITFQTVTLTDPTPLSYTITITDANCPSSDGLFDITASGGDGNYQYSIDSGATFQANNVFNNLPVGGYGIMIQDGNGCTVEGLEFIGSQPGTGPTILTQNFIEPLCNGSNNGSITILASGTPTIQYSIDGGQTYSNSGAFTGLSPGVYYIVVEDGNGCIEASQITLSEPDLLESTVTVLDETCVGNNGSIDFSTTGGVQPYQFSIDNGATFQTDSSFSGLTGGTYDYIVEDQNGCSVVGQVVLNSGGGPTVDSVNVINPSCPGSTNGSMEVFASSASGPITYSIDGGTNVQGSGLFTGLSSGAYDVQMEDSDGCITVQTVAVVDPATPTADFDFSPQSGVQPLDVNFTDQSVGASGYFWDFGDGNTSTSTNPTNTYSSSGTYQVMLVVDDGTCTDTAYGTVEVIAEPGITIPNVFTPNHDGYNDVFMVQAVGIEDLKATIYNRWGQIVAEWHGPNGWWDGRTMPAGETCPEGTYFYEIIAVGLDGVTFEEAGSVTLLR